jgi:hypothetical protein
MQRGSVLDIVDDEGFARARERGERRAEGVERIHRARQIRGRRRRFHWWRT